MKRLAWTLLALAAVLVALGSWLLGERVGVEPVIPSVEGAQIGAVESRATWLEESAPGASSASEEAEPASASERELVARRVVDLEVGPAVLGTVVDEDGTPIAGARVHLFDHALYGPLRAAGLLPARAVRELETGADGRFRFQVEDGRRMHAVAAQAPGHALKSRNQEPGIDVDLELVHAARLSGRVVGVDPATVQVRHSGPYWSEGTLREGKRTVSDGEGGYEVTGLRVGNACSLEIVPEGAIPYSEDVPIGATGELRHDIDLGETAWLEGHVDDALTERVIENASVTVVESSYLSLTVTTDALGRYRLRALGLPAQTLRGSANSEDPRRFGGITLQAHAPGYCAVTRAVYVVQGRTPETRIGLVPASRLEGRVLRGEGQPASGATVEWLAPEMVLDRDLGDIHNGPQSLRATCDGDGRFVLPEVVWGLSHSLLVARLDDVRRRFVWGASPPGPGTSRTIEIRLPETLGLQGRVASGSPYVPSPLAATGLRRISSMPIPMARVQLRRVGAREEDELESRADAAGLFAFEELEAGTYGLTVTRDGEQAPAHESQVEVGDPTIQPLQVWVPPPTRAVQGRLLGPGGVPVARQNVMISGLGGYVGMTLDDGTFRVDAPAISGIELILGVSLDGVVLEREVGQAAIHWQLPELCSVRVQVIEREGRKPVSGVLLTWTGPDPAEGGRCTLTGEPSGSFGARLPAGRLEIEVTRLERHVGAPHRQTIDVPAGSTATEFVIEL